jgi:hypothetical protein
MATRMQQRKGTAAQWTSANPILNAGEIGWESDTNKFKIGDGTNHWADLDYFADINSTANPAFGSSITFEGATANEFETVLQITDPTADRTITFPDATGTVALAANVAALSGATFTGAISGTSLTLSGNLTVQGTTTTIDSSVLQIQNSLVFEGATADAFETTVQVTDPTQDNVITLQNATGVIPLRDTSDTFTNKSIAFGTNTITATLAELNTAVTDANIVSIDGTETLTNKTLTSPIISGLTISDGSFVMEGATVDDFELTISAGNPTSDRTVTFQDITGTVALLTDIPSLTGYVTESGTQTLTNKTLTSPNVSNLIITDGSIVIEGSTPNDFETTITVTDPTADRAIAFPDAAGTVALTSDITVSASSTNTFSNKSIALGSNTVTGTTAEFNSALTDSNFVTTGDSGTITSTMILDGTILDADINASAAIAQSKISGLTTDLAAKAPLADPTFTGTVSAANLTLSGDLTVSGTTTNINSTNLVVEDKNIILGDVTSPTDTTADGGGITLKGATDKTFNWVDATDAWTSSEHINLASGKSLYLNGTLLKDVAETLTNKTLTAPKINLGLNAQTGTTYTLVLGDAGKVVTASNGSAITVTIPPSGDVAYATGSQITVLQKGAGQVTFAQGSGVTIRSTGATATAPKLRAQYSSATCVYEGSDVWYVVGDIS